MRWKMAVWSRGGDIDGVIAHSDAGSQYTSIKYSDRLAELGAAPSIGSVGDVYDNAMAESMMGAYKIELIKREGPWRNVDHVEFETLTYVNWFNNRRLHGELGYVPPSEFEETYYRDPRAATKAAEVITI